MRINNKIIVCVLITAGLIKSAIAHEDDIAILVQFNAKNSSLISDLKLEKYVMSCKGQDSKYHVSQIVPNNMGLNIAVTGPFKGDPRDTCKIDQSGSLDDDNKVYFTFGYLAVSFSYNGIPHSCYIEQNIGTTYKGGLYPEHNILRGRDAGNILSCSGLFKDDSYIVNPGDKGLSSHPGNITINVSE